MNKMPLPLHLLTVIPGFRMLGQTSFGGYFKIIVAWWENDCPDVFEHNIEWCSLSGMYQRDYDRHKSKIEPLLIRSLEILKEYRIEQKAKKKHLSQNVLKAQAARNANLAKRSTQSSIKGNIVDSITPVSPTPIKSQPQDFHEGWNLNKPKSPNINRTKAYTPMLLDK